MPLQGNRKVRERERRAASGRARRDVAGRSRPTRSGAFCTAERSTVDCRLSTVDVARTARPCDRPGAASSRRASSATVAARRRRPRRRRPRRRRFDPCAMASSCSWACCRGSSSPATAVGRGNADSAGGAADTAAVDGGGGADVSAGGGAFETCIPPRTADFLLQTLELASADGRVRVRLQVEPGDDTAVGETFAFETARLRPRAERRARVRHRPDRARVRLGSPQLERGGLGDRRRRHLRRLDDVRHHRRRLGTTSPHWTDRIEARDAAGETLWGPVDLTVNRCEAEGSGALNGCFQREKADL